jgi:hypothetical protein
MLELDGIEVTWDARVGLWFFGICSAYNDFSCSPRVSLWWKNKN